MANKARAIDAMPTKRFFIEMLVRDITLVSAIADLVDNSVDGARRLAGDPAWVAGRGERFDPGRPFDQLWVRVSISDQLFSISDNCGGIPWDIAQKYAFRFGRPDDAPATENSIGQFGIGMKRALFKLGDKFEVSTSDGAEPFVLNVNVAEWSKQDDWDFEDIEFKSDETLEAPGTRITVDPLHPHIAESLGKRRVAEQVAERLREVHQASIEQGLAISVNGVPVEGEHLGLLSGAGILPYFTERDLNVSSKRPVNVKIYAGIGESSPKDAGWSIYCNGRRIVGVDRSRLTGWGDGSSGAVPLFHNQFARFRGFVFFDSDDIDQLPWTTTKDGIDPEHWAFVAAKQSMVTSMRTVVDFLNKLDAEKANPPETTEPLEKLLASAAMRMTPLSMVVPSDRFVWPQRTVEKKPNTQSIQFRRLQSEIELAKGFFAVNSASAAGEQAFEYFLAREFDDE